MMLQSATDVYHTMDIALIRLYRTAGSVVVLLYKAYM